VEGARLAHGARQVFEDGAHAAELEDRDKVGGGGWEASMAASMGMPVPMKQVEASSKRRAATQIINSVLE
jgi:hypothetical protein